MKKVAALLACILFLFTACSSASSSVPAESTVSSRAEEPRMKKPRAEAPAQAEPEESENSEASAPAARASGEVPTIQEQVLMDEGGVKVTALSMGYEEFWGPMVKVLVENNSQQEVSVMVDRGAVNGLMMHMSMGSELKPGKKENTDISLRNETLQEYGIDTIGTLEMVFVVVETADYETLYQSPPVLLETSAAGQVSTPAPPKGVKVFDEQGLTASFLTFGSEENYPVTLEFYVENNSEETYSVSANDTSLNGFMTYGIVYGMILPGNAAYVTMEFTEDDLAECGVSSIADLTEVEFILQFYPDIEDGFDEKLESDVIRITT